MATCKLCSQELIIELDPEEQCLLDESPKIATLKACPSCNTTISTPSGQVLTKYHNEGGLQESLDIAPLIAEEAYLEANPTARPARAYLTMCAEGDVGGIVELLQAIEEDSDEGDLSPAELLRYQDPLDSSKSGLHIAIEKSQEEVVWVLLWLASGIATSAFPHEVMQAAQTMGAGRSTAQGPDIRGLVNSEGRTPGEVATTMGSTWAGLLGVGALSV